MREAGAHEARPPLTGELEDDVATHPAGGETAPVPQPAEMRGRGSARLARHPLTPETGLPPDELDVLLATKLYLPPPRANLVRRPRLTGRPDAGLQGPLTLIVAPAGYGKTTLLSDWRATLAVDAPAAHWPLAWLALDTADNDLARFLRYVIAALQTLHPDLGRAMLASLRTPQPPVAALLTLLLNDLAAQPDDLLLVLDDYHVIETPSIHQAMSFLLDHLPPQIHLVLATRVEPPLPLARLRARGHLTELRATDLRFSAEEAGAFLTRTMGLQLSADHVATLDACTEGWIAGLQLAALALQGRNPDHLIAEYRGAQRYILDFLAGEVFERQPDDVRRFLLHTSILDRLSGPLCDAVTAASTAIGQAMLERLDAANLFIVSLDDNRGWYRYHHLFAGFLRERLSREAPDLTPELHRRAYRWLEEHGLLAHAADHALSAAEYTQAARLIERVIAPTIWQRGELAAPQRWLEQLPRDVTRTRPRLCLDLAWVLLWSGQMEAAESRLQDAEYALDHAESSPDSPSTGTTPPASQTLRGEIAAIRADLARQRGESVAAIALARQALADLPAADRRVRGVTTGLLAGAYLWSGDAGAASRSYGEAVTLSQAPETITLALIAGGRLVLTQALAGRLHEAAATYRQTLDVATSSGMLATPALGVAHVGMGEVLREWNNLDGAATLVRQGIARCTESGGLAEMALDGSLTLARVLQARGDTEGALAELARAEGAARDAHVAQSAERIAVARARLWLTTTPGDVATATRWASTHEAAWAADENPSYVTLLARLTLARLRLAQGRRDEAAALLRLLLERAEMGGLVSHVIEILTLQARLLLEQGHPASSMVALSRALALAEPEGYVRVFVDEGAPMVALLRQAGARGVAPAYVAALLTACGAAAAPAGAAPPMIEPLSAREREVVRLLAAGLSTTEIAAQLFLTAGTVRNHLKNIYGKLAVHSRLQAVERARALGLL